MEPLLARRTWWWLVLVLGCPKMVYIIFPIVPFKCGQHLTVGVNVVDHDR